MIKEAIIRVVDGKDLEGPDMKRVFTEIMSGEAEPAQISAFITALRMKGESVEEITAAARVMREFAATIDLCSGVDIDAEDIDIDRETILDTCGTGGSGTNTFNISTTVAFVVAGSGVMVAKHGNRSVSSKCGSADLLKGLGINIEAPVDVVERCLNEVGIGFLYAPLLHKAMKYAIGPRREVGIRTVFNILGPLTNPAGAQAQVLGVYDESLTSVLAQVLGNLGSREAWVVHGADGLDEITTTTETKVSRWKDGKVEELTIKPEDFGLTRAKKDDLIGGDPEDNVKIARSILAGEKGPKRDIAVLNAAVAIVCGQQAKDIVEGIKIAQESLDSGKAQEKLDRMIAVTTAEEKV